MGQSGVLYCEASAVPPPEFEVVTETSAGQSLREQIITRTCAIEWNHIYISGGA